MNESKLRFIEWFPGVFVHPIKLFQGIQRRGPKLGDWLLPATILLLLSFIVLLLEFASDTFAAAKLDMVEGASIALRHYAFTFEGANDGVAAALNMLIGPAALFLAIMVGAALIWIIGRIAAPKKIDFKACLSIVGVHQMVAVVVALATLLIVVISGEAFSFRFDQFFQTNQNSPASLLMAGIQPFAIYQFFIPIFGLYVFGGMKLWRAIIMTLGIVIVGVILLIINFEPLSNLY